MKKKRIVLIIVIIIVLLIIIGSCSSKNQGTSNTAQTKADSKKTEAVVSSDKSETSESEQVAESTPETTPEPTEEPKKEEMSYEITNVINEISDSTFDDSKRFSVIIEITNTSDVPIYLDDCVLDYEDNDGHLIQTYDFLSNIPDIVQPNEKGYFYTNGSSAFDEDVNLDNGCNLVPSVSIAKAKGELVSHEVTDTSIYESYDSVGCKGRIVNETDEEIGLIYVTIVYYGSDGSVLGISGTNVTDIKPNGNTSFDCSGIFMEGFTVDDVADYRVYADEIYMQF